MHTASLPRPRRFSCSLHGAPRSLPGGRRRQHTRGPRSSPRAVHTLVRRTRLLHRMGQHLLPRGSAHPPRPAGAHVRSFEPRHSPRASGGGPAGPTTKDNMCKGSCDPGLLGWGEAGCRGALLCSYVSETFIFLLWHLNVQPVTRKLRKHIPMGWGGGGLGRRWPWGPWLHENCSRTGPGRRGHSRGPHRIPALSGTDRPRKAPRRILRRPRHYAQLAVQSYTMKHLEGPTETPFPDTPGVAGGLRLHLRHPPLWTRVTAPRPHGTVATRAAAEPGPVQVLGDRRPSEESGGRQPQLDEKH